MDYQAEIARLGASLKLLYAKYHKIYATAESLTAGLISSSIVNTPGSSAYFDRGFVTYSNEAKMELLGVKDETLKAVGAVSDETALEMVAGALEHSHADIAVAVTGIAGPDGGSDLKPVGTVWIAVMHRGQKPYAKRFVFAGTREEVRDQTVIAALSAIGDLTLGIEPFNRKS